MQVATVDVTCFGGATTPGTGEVGPQHTAYGIVDLGADHDFLAWCAIGYLNGLGPGAWDSGNALAAEVYAVDSVLLPASAFQGKLGPPNAFSNLHQTAYNGRGQVVTFRLRVFQPSEMEAAMKGVVLYE